MILDVSDTVLCPFCLGHALGGRKQLRLQRAWTIRVVGNSLGANDWTPQHNMLLVDRLILDTSEIPTVVRAFGP